MLTSMMRSRMLGGRFAAIGARGLAQGRGDAASARHLFLCGQLFFEGQEKWRQFCVRVHAGLRRAARCRTSCWRSWAGSRRRRSLTVCGRNIGAPKDTILVANSGRRGRASTHRFLGLERWPELCGEGASIERRQAALASGYTNDGLSPTARAKAHVLSNTVKSSNSGAWSRSSGRLAWDPRR